MIDPSTAYNYCETEYIAENIKEESGNPWNVSSLFQFSYFNCPECEFKTISDFTVFSRQTFVDHVSGQHPWAMKCLQKISDRLEHSIFEFSVNYDMYLLNENHFYQNSAGK